MTGARPAAGLAPALAQVRPHVMQCAAEPRMSKSYGLQGLPRVVYLVKVLWCPQEHVGLCFAYLGW